MITRSLSRRLERLETSTIPTSNTVVMLIQFVSPEKVVTSSMSIEVDLPATPSPKRRSRR
jgi:hypothetical protein